MTGALQQPRQHVPNLRCNLQILPGYECIGGHPTFLLSDPLRNRCFLLGWREHIILSSWSYSEVGRIAEVATMRLGYTIDTGIVIEFANFLINNELVEVHTPELSYRFDKRKPLKMSLVQWILHSYLYVRVPLIYPDRFLSATQSAIAPLYSKMFGWLMFWIACASIIMISRQIDAFAATFISYLSADGALSIGVALCISKLIHEFAHAYTAKRFGCHVPVMGIAIIVLWPVMFTDTSAAWTIHSRWQRIAVAGSGIIAEIYVGTVAALLWCILPDGPVRASVFLLATTSWISSLLINLSPLMRFDGYYMLADFTGIANLQDRAFALGRWGIRKVVLGAHGAPPEMGSRRKLLLMALYAYTAWIYRAILFIGIALTVYHLFFKFLGIILMMIEVVWFVLRPLWNEVRLWWRSRRLLTWNRHSIMSLCILVACIGALIIPMPGRHWAPAVFVAAEQLKVYSPSPARVARLHVNVGQTVTMGIKLVELESPELTHQLDNALARISELQWKEAHVSHQASAARQLGVIREELIALNNEADGLRKEIDQLTIRAPHDGIVAEIEDDITPGRWVARGALLVHIVNEKIQVIEAFVTETSLVDISVGQVGKFLTDNSIGHEITAEVARIDTNSVAVLPWQMLASENGGDIECLRSAKGKLVPRQTWYRVILRPNQHVDEPHYQQRGRVLLQSSAHSIITSLLRSLYVILIKESGF